MKAIKRAIDRLKGKRKPTEVGNAWMARLAREAGEEARSHRHRGFFKNCPSREEHLSERIDKFWDALRASRIE